MTVGVVAPGTVLGGRFDIGHLLGRGGLGELYRGVDRQTGELVAIRFFANDLARSETTLALLMEQATLAQQLSHHNVCRIVAVNEDPSDPYIVSEFVEGLSLREMIGRKRSDGSRFSPKGIYNLVAHLCHALEYAHKTMVHGLPGPGSVLVSEAGRVKLTDFGLIRALTPGSRARDRLGDRYCLAPEANFDPTSLTPQADFYALGILLHELVALQPPNGAPDEVALGPALTNVVRICLQENAQHRFQNAAELKLALREAIPLVNESSGGHPLPEGPRSEPAEGARQPASSTAFSETSRTPVAEVHQAHAAIPTTHHPAGRGPSIEELIHDPNDDPTECWLVQKGKLDFGPFSLPQIKEKLYQGDLSLDDSLIDQDSGERKPIRTHPLTREFVTHLQRHLVSEERRQTEAKRHHRTKTLTLIIVAILVLGLGGGGFVLYGLLKSDEPEKVASNEQASGEAIDIQGIEFVMKGEPPEQAKRRRRLKRKKESPTH